MKSFPASGLSRSLLLACVLGITPAFSAPPEDGICPIHHIKMESVSLRVVYGMPSQLEFEEMREQKSRFPNGRDYVLAGCVVKPAKSIPGYLCRDCVKARKEWIASRQTQSNSKP